MQKQHSASASLRSNNPNMAAARPMSSMQYRKSNEHLNALGKKTASSTQLHLQRYGSQTILSSNNNRGSQNRLELSPPPIPAHHQRQQQEIRSYEDRLEPEEGGFVVSGAADQDPWSRITSPPNVSIHRQGSLGSRNRIIVHGPNTTGPDDDVDDDDVENDDDDDEEEDDDEPEEEDDYEEQERLY